MYLTAGEKPPKLPCGPTSDNPGPMLLRQLAVAEKQLMKSCPSSEAISVPSISSAKYTNRKMPTWLSVASGTALPSSLTTSTLRGCSVCTTSRRTTLPISTVRTTLMPPAVLPALAPISISISIKIRENWGHRSKLSVAKPVVDMMELT